MSTTETEYLSVAEAAELLGVSKVTVYRAVGRGELPAVRLTPLCAIRVPRAVLEVPVGALRTGVSPAVEAQAHDGTREETA